MDMNGQHYGLAEYCNQSIADLRNFASTGAPAVDVARLVSSIVERVLPVGAAYFNLASVDSYSLLYEPAIHLLAPSGELFRAMFRLRNEVTLPSGVHSAVSTQPSQDRLSVLEFYWLHFGKHLTSGAPLSTQLGGGGEPAYARSVYFFLLQHYVEFFLPVDDHFGAASFVGDQLQTSLDYDYMGAAPSPLASINSPLRLFSRKFLSNAKDCLAPTQPRSASASDVLAASWTFVRALVDCWTASPLSDGAAAVAALRFVVKHVQRFVHSPTSAHAPSVAAFKRDLLKRVVAPPLFSFFQVTFNHWPLDCSFRVVLETWLTYVQPWRYSLQADGVQFGSDRVWTQFVEENAPFFAVFLPLALRRLARMDLCSSRNVVLVQRLLKVFLAQSDLFRLVTSGKLNGLNTTATGDIFADFIELAKALATAAESVRLESDALTSPSAAHHSFWSFLSAADETALSGDGANLSEQLASLSRLITDTFDVEPAAPDLSACVKPPPINDSRLPDSVRDERTGYLRLSPTGRRQVAGRLRQYDFEKAAKSAAAIDGATVRRHECTLLFPLLTSLAERVNRSAVVRQLADRYFDESLVGGVARRLLHPPSFPAPTSTPQIRDRMPYEPPRISARFLASYWLHLKLVAVFVLCYLFGLIPTSCVVFVFAVLYSAIGAFR